MKACRVEEERVRQAGLENVANQAKAAAARADVRALQRRYDADIGRREQADMRAQDFDA